MNSSLCLNSSPQAGEVSLFAPFKRKQSQLARFSKQNSLIIQNKSPLGFAQLLKQKFTQRESSPNSPSENSLITPSKSPFKLCSSLKVKIRHFHSSFKSKNSLKVMLTQCLPSFQSKNSLKEKVRSTLQAKIRSSL